MSKTEIIDGKIKDFRRQTFELRPEHIRLLRSAWVDWNDLEWGAPSIDPKRPYGNGNIHRDIYEELTEEEWDDEAYQPRDLTPAQWEEERERLFEVHRETQTALQVILSTGSFEPGLYEAPMYHNTLWRRVDG